MQRFLRRPIPTTRPAGDPTFTEEYDRGFWHGGRQVRKYTVPASAASLLDLSHGMLDYDTTIQAYVKRPDDARANP